MKLIILDRDGVINFDSPDYIKSPDEWIPIPGSLEAIVKLNQAGYTVTVATNQSGVGRGLYSPSVLAAIHQKLQLQLAALGGKIDFFAVCPHSPDENCRCRKPLPGLLLQISEHYHCSLANIPVVGDSYRDIEAALAVNAKPILVLTGNGIKTQSQLTSQQAINVYPDLQEAVISLLGNTFLPIIVAIA
ncbi:MAG: D-glycero-beta-D-manno-heptose 1,7-bisphosphate 7-phosphatase [Legionellales bacterium]|nr:D-glycero-beta-D-manno-heptose 1,7-bisphosphate 7-phosphatase [Legionellales bacterium]